MFVLLLPLSDAPWQVMYLPVKPDGVSFLAKVEIRYLPGVDRWFMSIMDAGTGNVLVNQIPLVCSYTRVNDLFQPFRHLFDGKGIGSFFVLRGVDAPSTADPAEKTLNECQLVWSDRYPASEVG